MSRFYRSEWCRSEKETLENVFLESNWKQNQNEISIEPNENLLDLIGGCREI